MTNLYKQVLDLFTVNRFKVAIEAKELFVRPVAPLPPEVQIEGMEKVNFICDGDEQSMTFSDFMKRKGKYPFAIALSHSPGGIEDFESTFSVDYHPDGSVTLYCVPVMIEGKLRHVHQMPEGIHIPGLGLIEEDGTLVDFAEDLEEF
ncbi:hypothetical protein D3W54_15910 (plasmid) [Komagataeibacter medellinensis]|uniref:Uncharacterized protein n=1 Tax=Komagataeibacter medellinensis TaxID=1177712 RepID=A0ABQ6VTU4_9PROT|nr:hypothetical protein [Komagataeibacter medellinensis]KAB8122193.1 hypothetical protein D3W54_15910 [Komagataeibacter medellinensis]